MTGSNNPFAAPETDAYGANSAAGPTSADGIWRQGDVLVMRKEAVLPDVCVKTNTPTSFRLKRALQWHHPAVYAALLFNVIIYLIIALIVRKTATIHVPLSDESRDKRSKWIKIGWGSALGGIVIMVLAGVTDLPLLILPGVVAFFFGLFGGLIGARTVWPSKIDKEYVYLKGVNPAYLSRFPSLPG